MTRPEPVLIIQDTTQLDFTDHAVVRDQLGPIGDDGGCGFQQHNSLAIEATGNALLGLVYQQTFVREKAPAGETRMQRQDRDERESARWAAGIRGAGPAPAGTCWVDICDREGDFFELLATARLLSHHFLIRLCQNRRVERPDSDATATHLLTAARSLLPSATDVVAITNRGGRPARQARVQLASTELWLPPPIKDKK